MGKIRGRGMGKGAVSLLVVLACSWFHNPCPLISVSVVLSNHVFNKLMALFMCCTLSTRSDSIVKLGGLNTRSLCHINQLVPTVHCCVS